jgi:hypothetical protein
VFQRLMKRAPFFPTRGNHEIVDQYQSAFSLPTNTADGTELYYSFDHGDVHFVCLHAPYWSLFATNLAQITWLTNDLAASAKPWKILFMHEPLLSSGTYAGSGDGVLPLFAALAAQDAVQASFAGADHSFERLAPTNGLHTCVAAGAGEGLYPLTKRHPASAQRWRTYHYLAVAITNDTMTIQAVGTNGAVFDTMTVQKALPPPQRYQATWHTPAIAPGPADDGDGNVVEQTFAFAGPPILPRAGRFSNLGRVYVNNDATNLYLGLEQAMFFPDSTVLLFLESPRQTGVTTMAGVGNGVLDPSGQGADGLDCLENLSFAGFRPSVGCLLGDEYGDGQARNFSRRWDLGYVGLNTGQGVFFLDATLPAVPGAWLQQFNRSPQSTAADTSTEAGADFIQVAIPFSSLGGLQPGETIKLGAVVGGGAYDPSAQTRVLDTSVLGYSLMGSGLGNVTLEGISVQLAVHPQPRLAITRWDGGAYRLSWNAQVGRSYDIEYSQDLRSFVRLTAPGLPVMASSTEASFVVEPPADATGFYRLRPAP